MSYTQMINKYILFSFYCSLLTTTFDISPPIFKNSKCFQIGRNAQLNIKFRFLTTWNVYIRNERDINSCFTFNMPVFKRIRIIFMFTRRMDLATGLEGGNGNG